ncbi:MAG: tetratricopeptide repeat protein [Candidatus Nitrosopolaris sp.]
MLNIQQEVDASMPTKISTKMLTTTIDSTIINTYAAKQWVNEIANVYADMEVEEVTVYKDKISFKIEFSGRTDTTPEEIGTRIEEYMTTNEGISVANISVRDGNQQYNLSGTYNATDWNNKGDSLFDMKKYKEAIECYDKAIELEPDFADAWESKGVALTDLKKYNEAIKCYDKAIELEPDYFFVWLHKAEALEALGNSKGAKEAFDRAKELDPHSR